MSYHELAEKIEAVARNLQRHADKLEGATLARAAQTFSRALSTFEKKLDALVMGADPDLRELELLVTPPATVPLKSASWARLFQSVFNTAPAKPTKAAFLKRTRERGCAAEALAAVRAEIVRVSVKPSPVPTDKAELQSEFLRLGGLTDEEFFAEMGSRWRKKTDLQRLAKANAIPVLKGTMTERLVEQILVYSRRAHGNIRG